MDAEQFKALAEAHGGSLDRWPMEMRGPAKRLIAEQPDLTSCLTHEAMLDHALGAWTMTSPSASLRETILARAPKTPRAFLAEVRAGLGFWLSGAGVATACAAGMLCGVAGSYAVHREAQDAALVASATPDVADAMTDPSEAQQL